MTIAEQLVATTTTLLASPVSGDGFFWGAESARKEAHRLLTEVYGPPCGPKLVRFVDCQQGWIANDRQDWVEDENALPHEECPRCHWPASSHWYKS